MRHARLLWALLALCVSSGPAFSQQDLDPPPWLERGYVETRLPGFWVRRTGDANDRIARLLALFAAGGFREFLRSGTTCSWNLSPRNARLADRANIPVRRRPGNDVGPQQTCDLIIGPKFDLGLVLDVPDPPRPEPPQPQPQPQNDPPKVRFVASNSTTETFRNDVYTSNWATARVVVEATDSNGVTRAVIEHRGERREMERIGSGADNRRVTFSATLRRTGDYSDTFAIVRAQDRLGDWSEPVRARLELVPHCGPEVPVSQPELERIQAGLICLDYLPEGEDDGRLGPATCRAIAAHMGRTAFAEFNRATRDTGAWRRLRASVEAACDDVPAPIPPAPEPTRPDPEPEARAPLPERQSPDDDRLIVWIAVGFGLLLLFTMLKGVRVRPVRDPVPPASVRVRVSTRADPAPQTEVLPLSLPGIAWRVTEDPAPSVTMSEVSP